MDLERDLFAITARQKEPEDAVLIAAVERAGFKAAVWRPRNGAEATSETGQAPAGAMPALVQKALDRAKREGKLVLVDFYADWCGPCKRMLNETYKDPKVASELERFVFLKVDTDDHPQASKHFGVAGIPDARVLKPDGTEVARFVGFKGASEVLGILRAARDADAGGR